MLILQGHSRAVRAVAYAPGDPQCLASAGDDRTVRLWDLRAPPRCVVLSSHGDSLLALAFGPDGSLASGGRSGSLVVWDVTELRHRATYRLAGPAVALAFSADGATLYAALRSQRYEGEAERLLRWDFRRPGPPGPLGWGPDVEGAAFAAGGEVLAVAGQYRSVELWQVGGVRQEPGLWCASRVRCLAFSPDEGRTLVVGSGRLAECWDVATLRQTATCRGHKAEVLAAAFRPDGRALLTGGADRTVRLWELATGQQLAAWDWQVGRVHAVAFSGDGMTAAAGGEKSALVVWDVDEG
jgi:WD40 repeat protein